MNSTEELYDVRIDYTLEGQISILVSANSAAEAEALAKEGFLKARFDTLVTKNGTRNVSVAPGSTRPVLV